MSSLRKHKCPVCSKKYTMASSLSRHKATMLKRGHQAHVEHYGGKPKKEKLPLHPEPKVEEKTLSFASPPSVSRKPDETEVEEKEPGPSDDLDELTLPGPEAEPDYVAPVEGMPGMPTMAEVPYDNTQSVLEYVGDMVSSFGTGELDSLQKMNKKDYELMAKHIAQSRGQDMSPAMAASVIYLKFIVFLISNMFKGTQRVLAKRKEKMAKKAEAEAEEQRKVSENGSTDRPEGA